MIVREMIRLMPFDKIKNIFLFAPPKNIAPLGSRETEEIHQAQSRDRRPVEIFRHPGSSPKGSGSDREIAPSSPMDREGTCC